MIRLCRPLSIAFLLVATAATVVGRVNGATYAVGTTSGRVFVGDVVRVDDSRLWLRAERDGVKIDRPIQWDSVALAMDNTREFTPHELREHLEHGFQQVSLQIENPFQDSPPEAGTQTAAVVSNLLPPAQTELRRFVESARERNSQVCSISIDAHVGHFYRTVEANGIILHVFALDGTGASVAVDGTLDVELVSEIPVGSRLGVQLPVIGRWTVRITPDLFGPAGAVFKLPFQAVHPEFDLSYGPRGVVHAKLNIPGNGSFEASDAMVRIRPYSEVRDQSQQLNGNRFFNTERVERWGR
jgi:hypothetical protein